MSSRNQFKAVGIVELFRNIRTEVVSSSSEGDNPSTLVMRIGPKKIAHCPIHWNFLYSIDFSDMVQCINRWGKTSVKAENLVLNNCRQRKIIESISKVFPNICVSVFTRALVEETVGLGDLPRFVVTS